MDEGTYPIELRLRSRMSRALRWTITTWRYRCAGLPWRVALALMWWSVWHPNSPPRLWYLDDNGRVKIRLMRVI